MAARLTTRRVAAVVLAAGAGSRFGGGKLLAPLRGRPVLQHVLDGVASLQLGTSVVVLGRDAPAIEAGITWHDERRVVNPHPERGLASSVQLGLGALGSSSAGAALVVLGDQPQLSPAVVHALLDALTSDHRPVAVPRYADGISGPNPVLLRRSAWSLVDDLTGDRGLGPVLAVRTDLVLEVPVSGSNPDIDTRADLARLARVSRGEA